jgi:hypothetical protein
MCPIASYNWNNGSNAGVWGLNLNNNRTNSNNNVGLRADSLLYLKAQQVRSGYDRDVPSSVTRNR